MTIARKFIRAGVSASVLAVIVVGLPILLWQLGSPLLPDHVPAWQEIRDALSRPDDGSLFLGALTLLGVFAWIMLTVSILAEVTAVLRGRVASRISFPGFGLSQAFAGVLVAAIVAAPGGQVSAASVGPPPLVSRVDVRVHSTSHVADQSPAAGPIYRIVERDTLWDIAQRSLGDPLRWREIVTLNGLNENAILHVGTELRLPSDAVIPQGRGDERTVTVKPGDTLSAIARDELGAAQRYPEIYSRNAGRPQPDGRSLADPDLIRPDWRLTLPSTSGSQPPGRAPEGPSAAPAPPQDRRDNPPTEQPRESSPNPRPAAPGPTAEPAAAAPTALPAALTLSGLLAAGLLSALAIGRRRQRRHRGRYRQIALPDPADGRLEWAAKEVADTRDAIWINLALRSMSAVLAADTSNRAPDVLAAWLGPSGLRLILSEPSEPLPPFVAAGEENQWLLPFDAALPVTDTTAARHLAPMPALVGVGQDGDDHLLLDLERLAMVQLTGDPSRVTDLLAHIAAELAFDQWCHGLDVLLVGFGADLALLDQERLRHVARLSDALAQLRGKLAITQETLTEHSLDSPLTGRAHGTAGDAWTPTILLVSSSDPVELEALAPLAVELSQIGRSATALVIACPDSALELPGWRIEVDQDGSLTVPGLTDRSVTADRLTPEIAGGLVRMVDTFLARDKPVPPADDPQPWAQDMGADGSWRPPTEPTDSSSGSTGDADDADDDASHDREGDNTDLTNDATSDGEPAGHSPVVELRPDLQQARNDLAVVESQDPDLDADLTSWLAAEPAGRPLISILGEPTVRAPGIRPRWRQPFFAEIIVYLAMHKRGRTPDELHADLWADGKIADNSLRRCIAEARRWAGNDTTQDPPRPYLPNIAPGGTYRLVGHLLDWDLFRRLRKRGRARIAARHDDADADHAAALRLVRGPVLTPLRMDGYLWVVRDRPDLHIPGFVIDTAHELVDHALSIGDTSLARWAADTARMVDADRSFDGPLLDLVRVAHAEDNPAEMERFAKILMYKHKAEEAEDLPVESFTIINEYFPGGIRASTAAPVDHA